LDAPDAIVRNRQFNPASVCAELLREEIFLPENTPKIYAVFSRKKMPDAFRIEAPNRHGLSDIAEDVPYIFSWTKKTLGKAHSKGYRYVRIEY